MDIKKILLVMLGVLVSTWTQLSYCALLVGFVLSFKYDHPLCIILSAILVVVVIIHVGEVICSNEQYKSDKKLLIKDNQVTYAFTIVAYVISLVVACRLSFFTCKVPLDTFKSSWDVLLTREDSLSAERVWVLSSMVPGDVQYRLHEYNTITANLIIYKNQIQNLVPSDTDNTSEYFRLKQEVSDYIGSISLPETNRKLNLSVSLMWLVTGLFAYCLKKPEIYLNRRSNKSEDIQ